MQTEKKQAEKEQHILIRVSPKNIWGIFSLLKISMTLSAVSGLFDLMQTATNFRFNIFDMMSALIYARISPSLFEIKNL